jgi:hypothetical protein
MGLFFNFFGKVIELFYPYRTCRSKAGDFKEMFGSSLQGSAAEKKKKENG